MSTTLATARTEMSARGLSHLSTARIDQFLNESHAEICNMAFWPFTETTSSGAAPLTVSDLRVVRYVTDDGNDRRLRHLAKHYLIESEGDLTTVGTPTCYYVDSGTIVRTYPVGGTITVAYYKKPETLDDAADTFLVPDAYMGAVYDLTYARGLKDMAAYQEAAALRALVEPQIEAMRAALLTNIDGPSEYVRVRMPE